MPKLKWQTVPVFGVEITYYFILNGETQGGMNGLGPLIKLGLAFVKNQSKDEDSNYQNITVLVLLDWAYHYEMPEKVWL